MTTHQVSLPVVGVEWVEPTAAGAGMLAFGIPDRADPWQRRNVLGALLLAVLGIAGVVVCWYVGAGKRTYHDQVPWLVGSIALAGVTVVGGVYWLVCGFRQVAMLEREVARYVAPWIVEARAALAAPVVVREAGTLVTGPGMNRAHRPGCLLARGKSGLVPVAPGELAARGLSGCGACGA